VLSLLGGAAGLLGLPPGPASAQHAVDPSGKAGDVLGDGATFSASRLKGLARLLAGTDFVDLDEPLPAALTGVTRRQYNTLLPKPDAMIWGTDGRTIGVQPLLRGPMFPQPVQLFLVENERIRSLAFRPDMFDLSALPADAEDLVDAGFSGFRLVATGGDGPPFPFAELQSATFLHARAGGQEFGPMARLLLVRPADRRGEELPAFRAFWIEMPKRGENSITCHALVDSPSIVAVLQCTLRPGTITVTDIETTLFPRETVDNIGYGGLGTSYFFGGTRRAPNRDLRLAAHKSDGLQVLTGKDEWLWRPLDNPETLQLSAFIDRSPKGFGFVQRSRSFDDFLDDIRRYELHPSVWLEPFSDWGEGSVQLIEIPSESEFNENALSYWRSDTPLEKGNEFSITYRLNWCWAPPTVPQDFTVVSTRVGTVPEHSVSDTQFVVDFASADFPAFATAGIAYALEASAGTIVSSQLVLLPERNSARVRFTLDPDGGDSAELRLSLKQGDLTISETWLYRWTP
jgi:glucans biosynthesis protein